MEDVMESTLDNRVSVSVEEKVNRGNYQTTTYRLFITSSVKELDKAEIKRVFALAKQAMAEK